MRFLVIGTNFISDLFADALRRLRERGVEASVGTVLSRREETGRAFIEKNALEAEIACDPDGAFALFERGAFDAAYVASPNVCHEAQSVFFLERGVPVLCEKPAALSAESLMRMGEAAKRGRAVFMEAMRPTHDAALAAICRAVGEIAPVRSAHLEFSQYSSRYDRHIAREAVNTFEPAMGNSALGDLGVYALAVAQALFKEELAVGAASAARLANGFEASGAAILTGSGFVCTASWSKVCRQAAPSVILGERGSITIDRLSEPRNVRLTRPDGTSESLVPDAAENNMIFEIADFIAAVRGASARDILADAPGLGEDRCFADSLARVRLVEQIQLAQGDR